MSSSPTPTGPGEGSPDGSTNGSANGSPDPQLPAWARQKVATAGMTGERFAAFIGPRAAVYERKFAPFAEDPSFVPTWNWSAALFQSAWFRYRKLYLSAFGFMILPGLAFRLLTGSDTQMTMSELQKPENQGLAMMQLGIGISSIIAAGGLGNWLLFRRARAALRLADMQALPEAETMPWLTRVGGINRIGVALAVAVFLVSTYATLRA